MCWLEGLVQSYNSSILAPVMLSTLALICSHTSLGEAETEPLYPIRVPFPPHSLRCRSVRMSVTTRFHKNAWTYLSS